MKPDDILTIPGARIQVQISQDTEQGQYNDSLFYSIDEWDKLQPEDIDKHKQTRVENWTAFVKEQSSKPPYIPTKEELLQQQDDEQKRLDEMITRLTSSTASKAELQAVADKLKSTYDTLIASASVSVKG